MSLPWGQVDFLISNEEEACALLSTYQTASGSKNSFASALAERLGIPVVVVTLGESGCAIYSNNVCRYHAIAKVNVVDETDAGDAFASTFAAYVTAGADENYAVRAAQSAAAQAISQVGSHDSMPSLGTSDQV